MSNILFSAKEVNGFKQPQIYRHNFRLYDVNFELPTGYIMGIIGKNGAGKTTFFDYIMNEKRHYTGEFLLDGKNIREDHIWTLDNIGFISEENEFLGQRSAEQNAQMLGRFYSSFDMNLFEETLENFKLPKNRTVSKMSRGEQIKFQLAFAVAHKPKLFLLDEATAGMDPVFRIDFYKLLRNLLKDETCSIIISTHIEEEIDRELDYIGLLENGHFVSFKENELV